MWYKTVKKWKITKTIVHRVVNFLDQSLLQPLNGIV